MSADEASWGGGGEKHKANFVSKRNSQNLVKIWEDSQPSAGPQAM